MKARYYIEGKLDGHAWEPIDDFGRRVEALAMLGEYEIAFGSGWKFRIRHRGKIVNPESLY